MFNVEKNIKMNGPVSSKYPFDKMEIGDSFEFDSEIAQKVRSSSSQYARIHGFKFSIKMTSENKCRCWRIA